MLPGCSMLQRGAPVHVVCSGPGIENAGAAARVLGSRGMTILGSLGVSGGLRPDLGAGDLTLADEIYERTADTYLRTWKADGFILDAVNEACQAAYLVVHRGAILTVERPVSTRAEKAMCFKKTRALAIDMESAAVAREADAAGIPFFALRAVCDPAAFSLPAFIPRCLDPNGGIRTLFLCGRLLKQPFAVVRLLRLQMAFGKALRGLNAAWQGPLSDVLPELIESYR